MPRPPSPAARATLYRLLDLPELEAAVREKYLQSPDFEVTSLQVQGRDALLVRGAMATSTVSWSAALHELTGLTVDLGNSTAAAVLLLRTQTMTPNRVSDDEDTADGPAGVDAEQSGEQPVTDDGPATAQDGTPPAEGGAEHPDDGRLNAWAISYGMGFQLLEVSHIDPGFGQRIALRTAVPRELTSLTRTTLDQRARTERASIPGGDDLRGFGAGAPGELVTRLVATAELSSLTAGEKPIRLRGADALSVPLGRQPDQLVDDLDELDRILQLSVPDKELALLEQLVAVKNPDLLDELEGELATALESPSQHRLGLSWPHERGDENGTPSSYRIHNGGRRFAGPQDGLPDLSAVLAPLEALQREERIERLKRMRVQLYSDLEADQAVSGAIPAIRWVTFEHDRENKRYCLHDGHWYLMNQEYAERLRVQVQAIFQRDAGVVLPQWPADTYEAGYDELVAEKLGGICLDQDLIRTEQHPRGIEACDVLLEDGSLVHVKELSDSAAASHLLAQALVSTDALLYDQQAVAKLQEKVANAGWNPGKLPARPHRVVLGIARKGKPITAQNLFTFTQVTLVRQEQMLRGRGVDVVVVAIDRPA